MSDAKYFTKGKIQELRIELNAYQEKKDSKFIKTKIALKRIIANMTMGNDMSSLFPDVMACINIPLIEIKKMVYLFLVNYCKNHPELALMAVNSFIKDIKDPNPMIRAIALRTMGYLQIDKIENCLLDPLIQSLKDSDAFVKKTAAICIGKLYFSNRNLYFNEQLNLKLKDLLTDSNAIVISTAISILLEIYLKEEEIGKTNQNLTEIFTFNLCSKLVLALNESSEWGQVYIMEAMMFFKPLNSNDAISLIEKLSFRFSHANASIGLTAIKVVLHLCNFINSSNNCSVYFKKISNSLVTLMQNSFEIQFVVLSDIKLIIQKFPEILSNEFKIFFCKYNDPIYIKLAKLEVLLFLINQANVEDLLAELYEYSTEVDVEFVKKSVRLIGHIAIKIESASVKCVNYIVQESIIVMKDVFRKYPGKFESLIGVLCEHLDILDELEAKASMIWIIGHYSERISNSLDLLKMFMETFSEEDFQVQLALLTAIVKHFLKKPKEGQEILTEILNKTTTMLNPDLRDRGYFYWRLLNSDPISAKNVILFNNSKISINSSHVENELLEDLLFNLSNLSSILQKPGKVKAVKTEKLKDNLQAAEKAKPVDLIKPDSFDVPIVDLRLLQLEPRISSSSSSSPIKQYTSPVMNDLLDVFGTPPASSMAHFASPSSDQLPPLPASTTADLPLLINSKGLEIYGAIRLHSNQQYLYLVFQNVSTKSFNSFSLHFDKNKFGFDCNPQLEISVLNLKSFVNLPVLMKFNEDRVENKNSTILKIAIRCNAGQSSELLFGELEIPILAVLDSNFEEFSSKTTFLQNWKQIMNETKWQFECWKRIDQVKSLLSTNRIFLVAEREIAGQLVLYLVAKLIRNEEIYFEIRLVGNLIMVSVKTKAIYYLDGLKRGLDSIFK